ncbi:MAG: MXAN_2562 family outer membrane beta-barrel protein, partial [Polyangiaceae bacterium]
MKRTFVRGALAAAVVAGIVAASTQARAQEDRQDDPLMGKHRKMESSQNFAFELRFAPFVPAIDTDPSLHGATPYHDTFHNSSRVLFEMELDWQPLRIPHLGTLGPGLGIGYTKMSGPAPFLNPHPNPDGSVSTISGETTALEIYPLYAVAVLRADVLWRELHIPLVPYAKLGIGYWLWRASNQLGTSTYGGQSGVGGSLGTQLAVGLGFNLNVFDEYSAKNFDDAVGVNNTYVFAEYARSDLDGLGIQGNPLRVGGRAWT